MNNQKAQLIADELRDIGFQLKRIADVLEEGEIAVNKDQLNRIISAVKREH